MKTFLAALLTIWFSLSAGASAGTQHGPAPTALVLYIGGFSGPVYRVDLTSGGMAVNYQAEVRGKETRKTLIRIPPERWIAFHKALDEAKVWKWKKEYQEPVADGTSWKVAITFRDAKIISAGHNGYPDKAQFDKFLAAVSTLLEGRDFK